MHDAGAGVGVHSDRFAPYFERILVSDISEENVRVARMPLGNNEKYEFQVANLKDGVDIPAASLDLFLSSVAMHFCGKDIGKAVASAAQQIKPGGTFAVAAFGVAVFADPEVQNLWLRWNQIDSEALIASRSHDDKEFRDIFRVAASAFDAIPLPEDIFQVGAMRIKANFPRGWSWRAMQIPPRRESEFPHWSQVGENDELVAETDQDWTFAMDLEGLKAHRASFPSLPTEEGAHLWTEMQELVGDRPISGVWPVSLILATRK